MNNCLLREQDRNLDFPFYDLLCCRAGSYSEDTDQEKAYIVDAIGRIVVVPVRNGAVLGIVASAPPRFTRRDPLVDFYPVLITISQNELTLV